MESSSSLLGYTITFSNEPRDFMLVRVPNDDGDDGVSEEEEEDSVDEENDGTASSNDKEEEEDDYSSSKSRSFNHFTSSNVRKRNNKIPPAQLVKPNKYKKRSPLIKLFNGTNSCFLEDGFTFLACGWDGHVYVANMTCPWGMRRIAMKIGTKEIEYKDSDDEGRSSTKFQFETELKQSDLQGFHDRMVSSSYSNNTATIIEEEHVKTMFAFFYGTVRIPAEMMLSSIGDANWICHTQTIALRKSHHRKKKFVAKVMNYIPKMLALDSVLDRTTRGNNPPLSNELKQTIIAQLVEMYSHLHDRHIVHCDILNFRHFLWDEHMNQTTLVDFERINILVEDGKGWKSMSKTKGNRLHRQKLWQQLQLLALIGNMCNVKPEDEFDEPSIAVPNACNGDHIYDENFDLENDPLYEQISNAFQQCGFSTTWKINPVLEGQKMWTLMQIQQNYESLRKWASTTTTTA